MPHGRNESQTLQITVLPVPAELDGSPGGGDDDGDGFTNALELAWGSDPSAVDSTPLGGANGLAPAALRVTGLNVRLWQNPLGIETAKFTSSSGTYRVEVKAVMPAPKDFNPASTRLGLSVCGLAWAVMLDGSGHARFGGVNVVVRANPPRGATRLVSISATFDGTYLALPAELAQPYGATRDETAMIVLGGNAYSGKAMLMTKTSKRAIVFNAVK